MAGSKPADAPNVISMLLIPRIGQSPPLPSVPRRSHQLVGCKGADDASYTIRFTPRKSTSIWSAVNMKRAAVLIKEGRMTAAGLKAFEARREDMSGIYSYERRPDALVESYASLLAGSARAARFFAQQTPSYRRTVTWWVISATQEETRLRRAQTLIELSGKVS